MIHVKPRCKWRGRRIAWCRRYGKFCDAPREYEYCLGYKPIEHHPATPLVKVSRNIRVLRDQFFPLEREHFPLGEVFPETLRLKPLFDMQQSLIEHKFPHERTMVMDNVISCAGDIYREMTHAYPDYSYVGEKWEKLTAWSAKPPLSWLQAGDWVEIRNELQNPSYKALRDQYLNNLQKLREETVKMPMDPKRSAVMIESLDMIKALIPWFESLDPYAPPKWQLDKLTDAIYNYFPREFFKGSWVQIPPEEQIIEEIRSEYPELKYITISWASAVWVGDKARTDAYGVILLNREMKWDKEELEYSVLHEYCHVKLDHYKKTYITREEKIADESEAHGCTFDILMRHGKSWNEAMRMFEKATELKRSGLNIYTSMYNMSMPSTLELKNRFGPELKQMISEAEGQKREIGAMLCRTAAGQTHLSRACYGRRETVTVADCHDGLSPLGSFHVHLGGTDVFSVPDLELAIKKEQLSCLGYTRTGQSYLKCIMPKRYYELPYQTQASIKQSLDQARQDIERANQLFRTSPSNPEAKLLSQRAQANLRQVEQILGVYEVWL